MKLIAKRFQGLPAEPRHCGDCDSEHIGVVPCGMTWLQRMRSTQTDVAVNESRSRVQYWDDEGLKEVFGQTKAERREQMLDETEGRGPIYQGQEMTPEDAKLYFGDD